MSAAEGKLPRDPKTTALIFASGKMVVTGAKLEDDEHLASRKYVRIVQKLGFDAKFSEFKIQNIVGSCDVKFPICLEDLVYSHGQFSSYEPEVRVLSVIYCTPALIMPTKLFPGLIYRMIKPKVVLLIFVSGIIVLTGVKVTGRSLGMSLLALPTLTFPSACEGAGGDIHGVQHDIHQTATTSQQLRPRRLHDDDCDRDIATAPQRRPRGNDDGEGDDEDEDGRRHPQHPRYDRDCDKVMTPRRSLSLVALCS